MKGLYNPRQEHDACGVGFIVKVDGNKSHEIVEKGIQILCNLEHRGAIGGDGKTGDGAGMLVQIPDTFFRKQVSFSLPKAGAYGVGMLFLPVDQKKRNKAFNIINGIIAAENCSCRGWREVPVDADCLGETAKSIMPSIWQVFISAGEFRDETLERKCYVLRKQIEFRALQEGLSLEELYCA